MAANSASSGAVESAPTRPWIGGAAVEAGHHVAGHPAPAVGRAPVDLGVRRQRVVDDCARLEPVHERLGYSLPTTKSMHSVSASTSAGSIAGYIAIRSWLRPSLR